MTLRKNGLKIRPCGQGEETRTTTWDRKGRTGRRQERVIVLSFHLRVIPD